MDLLDDRYSFRLNATRGMTSSATMGTHVSDASILIGQVLRRCLMQVLMRLFHSVRTENVDDVWCVSPSKTKWLEIQNLILERLPQSQRSKIKFFAPEDVEDYLKQFDERETTLMLGYEVIAVTVASEYEDVEYQETHLR